MLPEQRTAAVDPRKRFRIVLVKPSHYDDDGYVIRWYRSPMPANSLASVYGLLDDCAQRKVLGPDIDIDIVAKKLDEARQQIQPSLGASAYNFSPQALEAASTVALNAEMHYSR